MSLPVTNTPLASSRPSLGKVLLRWAAVVVCVVILIQTAIVVRLDPILLITKRQNAAEYLFGRTLSQQDRADALLQAERMPRMVAATQAERELRASATGSSLNTLELTRQSRILADAKLAEMTPQQKDAIIAAEFGRILDARRGGYFPPETGRDNIRAYLLALGETLAIALWGTLIAMVLSVPLALLAAQSTLRIIAPGEGLWHHALRWISRFIVRRFLDATRGFNEYVLALILVAVIGLGPFAGVLALAIHSLGVLGKVLSEALETLDNQQVEGVTATGAASAQVISYAVFPQIMPFAISQSLLRFETNVRSATILGFCGAGGIGFLMYDKINGYAYREVCTMMIIIIVTVALIDQACGRLMKAFL